jgi:N-acetylglucosaminyldiphosphoundecaprenol N-acetyl-beta-D-mannosaminyltransferase
MAARSPRSTSFDRHAIGPTPIGPISAESVSITESQLSRLLSDRDRINILGCSIDPFTMEEAIEQCLAMARGRRQEHLIITVNAAILVMVRKDEALRRVIESGDMVLADGMSLVWVARALGIRLRNRVAGVDLMVELIKAAGRDQLRLFFLGAREEVVRKLIDSVHDNSPGAVVAGYRNGYFTPQQYDEVVRQIHDSNADLLFVGMPTPFKEVWCHNYRHELGVPAIIPVGGAFDVLAGAVKRAPRWMQACCLEWFWRLLCEPRKMWKRYLVTNTVFIGMFLRALCLKLLPTRTPTVGTDLSAAPGREAKQ